MIFYFVKWLFGTKMKHTVFFFSFLRRVFSKKDERSTSGGGGAVGPVSIYIQNRIRNMSNHIHQFHSTSSAVSLYFWSTSRGRGQGSKMTPLSSFFSFTIICFMCLFYYFYFLNVMFYESFLYDDLLQKIAFLPVPAQNKSHVNYATFIFYVGGHYTVRTFLK